MPQSAHSRVETAVAPARWPRLSALRVVRRLPVVPKPVAGEAFASWVDRVACKLETAPGQAARALGLECRGGASSTRPLFFGVTLSSASLRGLRDATGLAARDLRRMQLARYEGSALDLTGLDLAREASLTGVAIREWMMPTSSRACPHCLAEGPVWPLWWRLGIAAVCPRHRCLLIDVCPACGVRLRRGSKRAFRGLLTRPPLPAPGQCGNRPPDGPKGRAGLCCQPLTAIPTTTVPDPLVALQRHALDVAEGLPARLAGEPVSGADWFAALRFLTAMARLSADNDDFGGLPGFAAEAFLQGQQLREAKQRGGSGSQLGAMPATATQALASLTLASRVLQAPDEDAGAGRLALWAQRAAARRRAAGGGDPLRHLTRPAVLDRMAAAVSPRPSRVAGALSVVEPRLLDSWNIPHLADPAAYRAVIAVHLPGTAEVSGRRLTALALARLAGAPSWAGAATALDMDARKAARAANTLVQRIEDPDAFWTAVRTTAQRMRERGVSDYAARRAALADLREIPHRDLVPVFHPLGRDVTWQRQRHAAAWVWQHLTGGDVHEAPAYALGWEDGTTTGSIREGWRRFHTSLPTPAAAALTAWGTAHLAQKGCS